MSEGMTRFEGIETCLVALVNTPPCKSEGMTRFEGIETQQGLSLSYILLCLKV